MKKYLGLWMCLLLVSTFSLGCGDDEDESGGNAGAGGAAGTMAGQGGSGGTAGTSAGAGGTTGGAGGMMAGEGGAAGTSAGEGGTTGGAGGMGGQDPMDIVETAIAAGSFTKLAEALTAADLVETLQGAGPFTVFAPTDDAFEAFEEANPGVLEGLSVAELTAVLTYHVIAGDVRAADLKEGGVAVTVGGSPVAFELEGGATILGGEGSSAAISMIDIEASNGVIHVIDAIILPPSADIVATAQGIDDFSSLVEAVIAADLVEALQGDGPLTVFAPTNAAFEAIAEVAAGLSTEELTNVLLYHVVDGAVGAGDLVAGAVPTLLEGASVTVDLSDGAKINDSNVTTANVLTKNGVIHVIDAVLIPE